MSESFKSVRATDLDPAVEPGPDGRIAATDAIKILEDGILASVAELTNEGAMTELDSVVAITTLGIVTGALEQTGADEGRVTIQAIMRLVTMHAQFIRAVSDLTEEALESVPTSLQNETSDDDIPF